MSHTRPAPAREPRRAILLLCHYYPGAAGTIVDHIQAFPAHSENEYFVLSNLGDLPDWLDLSRFDALMFHYSLIACYDNYISPAGRERIRRFKGFKAAFVQDDYRWIDDTVAAFAYMGIHALFPLTGPDIMDAVYSPAKLPGVRRETVLAGYVPQELVRLEVKPLAQRRLDVGYRARKLPAWMGSHTLQKWQIADRFTADAARFGLSVDISCREEDRIYGNDWIDFVADCRATLGTESGASVCDFTGAIQRNVEAHVKRDPEVTFETLRNLYFRDEDCRIMMNVISPRCFEAAALRTMMILYEGEYSSVLKPWRHYVPLKRDHSNMEDVVRMLRSPADAQAIVDRAYREVACNHQYSYAAMVALVDRVMNEEWRADMAAPRNRMTAEAFDWLREHQPRLTARAAPYRDVEALWVPVGNLESAAANRRSRGELRLDLKKELSVSQIAISLDAPPGPSARQWRLRGHAKGRERFSITVTGSGSDSCFQLLALPAELPASVALYLGDVAGVSAVAVLGSEKAPIRKMSARFRDRLRALALRVWIVLPERIKDMLRPIVRQLRFAAQRAWRAVGL